MTCCCACGGAPNRLATLDEALRIQKLVETMLRGTNGSGQAA